MKIPSTIKPLLKTILLTLFPRQFWSRKFMALAKAIPEPELRLVPFFCDTGKISVDIGAACGLFFSAHVQSVTGGVRFRATTSTGGGTYRDV